MAVLGRKHVLSLALFFLLFFSFGCTGTETHTIGADGTDNIVVELEKKGAMEGQTCDTVKAMLLSLAEMNSTDETKKEIDDIDCTETGSRIIMRMRIPMSEEEGPVSLVVREDKEYYRFEEERMTLNVTVIMPSSVSSHNGNLVNSRTIYFEPLPIEPSNGFGQPALDPTIYVECRKPEPQPLDEAIKFLTTGWNLEMEEYSIVCCLGAGAAFLLLVYSLLSMRG